MFCFDKYKKNWVVKLVFLFSLLVFSSEVFCSARDLVGYWTTVSDKNGESTSVIKIWQDKKGQYEGTVVKIFKRKDTVYYCNRCPAPFAHKPILGLTIFDSLKADKVGYYRHGRILDPKSGHVYHLNMTVVSPEKLKVRGYIGISLFGRTQYWYRYHGKTTRLVSA
jgi:uncharacterized protein (DUF2147 family)